IAKEPNNTAFETYWSEFHAALTDKNFKKIQTLSAASITLRGAVDGIKPKKLAAKDFDKTFAAILDTEVSEYQGDKHVTQTTYAKMKSLAKPKVEDNLKQQRIEGFVFENEKGTWKLIEIYWDELE
ncbi:MAG: hypothetical protein RL497_3075, partial [Pseudomonadota bacterium]